MSELYLVRHAKAGNRLKWTGDDRLRPLTKPGRLQARGLVHLLEGRTLDRIVSSPSVRCLETVRPLARERGLPVEESEALVEGAQLAPALALLANVGDAPAVLCSHGDVIPLLVLHLAELGMVIEGDRDWKKGSTWVLDRDGDGFDRARYLPPPS